MKPLSVKCQLNITVAILLILAVWGIIYKIQVLGFTFRPNAKVPIWQVEARIDFDAQNQPVRISLAAPEKQSSGQLLSSAEISPTGYHFSYTGSGSERRAQWTTSKDSGPQTIFYHTKVFDTRKSQDILEAPAPAPAEKMLWDNDGERLAAEKLIQTLRKSSANQNQLILSLMKIMFAEAPAPEFKLLLGRNPDTSARIRCTLQILADMEIPARPIYGVILQNGRRRQLVQTFDVYYDGAWHAYNPYRQTTGFPKNYLILRRGGKSLLDVEGGIDSSVRFSVFKSSAPLMNVVPARAKSHGRTFGAFSVYSLPLESQNMFKRIALIPLGILIVVIVRNLIGIQTMGTFMPVLIAMAFLDTRLLPGLTSFLAITAVGLVIRTLLSRLNLLLVPRIAAVVLVVILLMKAFCIFSFCFGFTEGLVVTMFPLIIMAWTIERASILWEEDGAMNTLKQFGASLVTGLICYAVLSNSYVQHITYAFSEIDLIVLALILLLGTYTGYRLTELRRFKSLVQK